MSVTSQRILLSAMDGQRPRSIARQLEDEALIASEHARGALLAAEWYRERNVDVAPLKKIAEQGALTWVHTISPVAVSQRRNPGEHGVWLPPAGVEDTFKWHRCLHNLQLLERIFPESTEWLLESGPRVRGDLRGLTRLVWAADAPPERINDVFWKLSQRRRS